MIYQFVIGNVKQYLLQEVRMKRPGKEQYSDYSCFFLFP